MELKNAIIEIINFWKINLSDEYVLLVNTKRIKNYPENILFGNITPSSKKGWFKIDLSGKLGYSYISLDEFLSKVFENLDFTIMPIKKIGFISNDLLYSFDIQIENDILSVSLTIDNMTYSRGRMGGYIKAVCKNGLWKLSGGEWYRERVSRYDNYSGSIHNCINYIFENENLLEHPYQGMINSYPMKYFETQNADLEINENGRIELPLLCIGNSL